MEHPPKNICKEGPYICTYVYKADSMFHKAGDVCGKKCIHPDRCPEHLSTGCHAPVAGKGYTSHKCTYVFRRDTKMHRIGDICGKHCTRGNYCSFHSPDYFQNQKDYRTKKLKSCVRNKPDPDFRRQYEKVLTPAALAFVVKDMFDVACFTDETKYKMIKEIFTASYSRQAFTECEKEVGNDIQCTVKKVLGRDSNPYALLHPVKEKQVSVTGKRKECETAARETMKKLKKKVKDKQY
eukprot:TRINITY_DN392_c0_g1_i2.p1 TRINITY_DN392_c0_g1~~TRINITY_DN392_c0_g1_i2.p1  ORF type:complete len:238 (-),score=24.24 TRINITY_DN392_c0_g1_i2:91-804(-)